MSQSLMSTFAVDTEGHEERCFNFNSQWIERGRGLLGSSEGETTTTHASEHVFVSQMDHFASWESGSPDLQTDLDGKIGKEGEFEKVSTRLLGICAWMVGNCNGLKARLIATLAKSIGSGKRQAIVHAVFSM